MTMQIIEILFSGVVGVVLGAWLGAWWAYGFQKKLLAQQEKYQQRLLDQQLVAEQKIHEELLKFLEKASLAEAIGGKSLREQIHTDAIFIRQAIEALKQ